MRYLYSKDGLIFAECEICQKVMKFKEKDFDKIAEGVECFCGNISNNIVGMPVKNNVTPISNKNAVQQVIYAQPTGAHCPTCGSKNIQKISLASKAIGGYMFGIFSSNIRNTFKCNDCGYKW